MVRNFSALRNWKDPWLAARAGLVLLVLGNLAAGWMVFRPIGGSLEELRQELKEQRSELRRRHATLERMRILTSKVDKGRTEEDRFLQDYFLRPRTAYSTVLADLLEAANASHIQPKDHAYADEPVEGSDNLRMMTISGNYEGAYADLIRFINALDHMPRLLIVESLRAAPQQATGRLNVNIKLHAFIRDDESPSGVPLGAGPLAQAKAVGE